MSDAEPSVYRDHAVVNGVPIYFKSTIRQWLDWPPDVFDTLHRWNKDRELSFRGEAVWGGFDTGFPTLTKKCVECGRFFNQVNACLLRDRWTCDDCVIVLARAA